MVLTISLRLPTLHIWKNYNRSQQSVTNIMVYDDMGDSRQARNVLDKYHKTAGRGNSGKISKCSCHLLIVRRCMMRLNPKCIIPEAGVPFSMVTVF